MGKIIMTVDDSASVRAMIADTLKAEGYEVVEAEDGQDALNKLADKSVDVIISDINMPNMNGIELIREVRKDAANKFLPIIMLTTESSPQQKQEGKDAGATGWIIKPFKADKLVSAIKRVIK